MESSKGRPSSGARRLPGSGKTILALQFLVAQAKAMGAKRIVFDALDIVLALLPDAAAKRREVYRRNPWLLAKELTGMSTTKAGGDEASSIVQEQFGFIQFMVDCAIILNHKVVMGVSQRNIRVQKYRGSSFDENESPFLIGKAGIEVAVARTLGRLDANVTHERVSTGIKRLDTMLGGGYYRGKRKSEQTRGHARMGELRGSDTPSLRRRKSRLA